MCGLDHSAMLGRTRPGDRGSWGLLDRRFFDGRVDPHGIGQISGVGSPVHEALGMRGIGGGEDAVSMRAHRLRLTEVDDGWREEAEPAVPMVLVVPAKKLLAERAAVFERSEAIRELRTVLQRSEVGLRKTDCRWRHTAGCAS